MNKIAFFFIAICCLTLSALEAFSCIPTVYHASLARLQGRVTDASEFPLSNALVQIFKSRKHELVVETRTDSNGRFSIPELRNGSYVLESKSDPLFTTTLVVIKLDSSLGSDRELLVTLVPYTFCTGTAVVRRVAEKNDTTKLAEQVKTEFLHAWTGYKKYCWGHDDLKPISKTCRDWYGTPILMTAVDSLDSLYLLGFKKEADETREYIAKNLSFDKDISVQNFEITIRVLGGLLSSYQMSGDKRLLALADDLGMRLLPVFSSPTGLPYRFVNLKTGKTSDPVSNPAETGTLLIEFGALSKLTGTPIYYEKAKRALVETYKRRSDIGLVGENINVETGKWTNPDSHVSGGIDSYYEYLLKCAVLFGDQDCHSMWEDSISKVNTYLADEQTVNKGKMRGELSSNGGLWYGHADMNTGKRTATTTGALDAFFPAVLALDGDLNRARALQDSMFKMWELNHIEPEVYDYKTGKVDHAGYPLRPEIVESTFYLYRYTKDPKYLAMGQEMWNDFVKYCRTDEAYAGLKSAVTKEKTDYMHSFVFAETLKYFYLLFAPEKTLDLKQFVFNTEAHPIRRTWK